MSEKVIRELVRQNPGQATFEEYKLVYDVVVARAPCNLLVFGVGRDSALWLTANQDGRTVFLEDVAEWAGFARNEVPGIDVREVRYGTLRIFWHLLKYAPSTLMMNDLPDDVATAGWDVILVDAPRGTRWYRPGRMKSIYTASVLGRRAGADVLVHDCHRRVEREASDRFLGADRCVDHAGSMRHYALR
ncbi:MAG: hypothetical protein OEN56_08575 [Gemmatimonadota bacterium]|nr:hypothetical protein [Gemmatimonadota bacterium]